MTTGDKLSKLRKERNYTQEQLADLLCVSRQAVSKWESDAAFPETETLIRLSELYGCSLDYLLRDKPEEAETDDGGTAGGAENSAADCAVSNAASLIRKAFRERKSQKTFHGLPLWHFGRNARGVIAVGMNARGIISVGLFSRGVISVGLLSFGLLSMGMLSLGLLTLGMIAAGVLSAGCFSAGILSAGAVSLGIVSVGALSVGDFSVGALSIGKYAALGDNAKAMIAMGDTKAAGSLFSRVGELSGADVSLVKTLLDENVPAYLSWAAALFKLFI